MSRTITALFDTRADADAGAERLRQAGVDAAHVRVHDQSSHSTTGDYSTHEDKGLWASIKGAFLPDNRHAYEEGIRRGGFLLTADVEDDRTPAAVAALEEANSIDLDQRTQQWQDEGWYSPEASAIGADEAAPYGYQDADYSGTRHRTYSTRPIDDRAI